MKHSHLVLSKVAALCLLASLALAPAAGVAASGGAADQQVVGYFIEWGIYGRNYLVKNIVTSGSAPNLTVINYAFANAAPDASGQVVCKLFDEWADYQVPWTAEQSVDGQPVTWPNPILGNFQQLKALKAMYPNIRVVISLGGWTGSKYFSDAALTPESRQAFVQSCIDMFILGNLPDPGWGGMGGPGAAAGVFDGIDVDWEYPAYPGNPGNIYRPEDTENFTALLAEFRSQLDAVRPGLLLTIAAPAGEAYTKIQVNQIPSSLDWINLMTYDFHGTWEMVTNLQANLRTSEKDPFSPISVEDTVSRYLAAGAPADKLVVGVPFYGRGWTGVTNANRGLYQPATAAAPGVWEAGVNDFKELKPLLDSGAFERFWDGHMMGAWLFDGNTFWTYDDVQTIQQKALFIRKMGLGGFMFWELSGDTADGSLVKAMVGGN